jgi:hypothetical protein
MTGCRACEHVFDDVAGRAVLALPPRARQRQPHARHRGRVELPRLGLADALALLLVYRDGDRSRFERAAVRWHGRLCLELRELSNADAALALAALRALADSRQRRARRSPRCSAPTASRARKT